MEITNVEKEFFEYASSFINEEQRNSFQRILEDDAMSTFLDSYAMNASENYLKDIPGLSNYPEFKEFLEFEIMRALRVGYSVKEACNRFYLESNEYRNFVEQQKKDKEKFNVKTVINSILESLKIR